MAGFILYSTRETISVEHIPREDIITSLMEYLAPGEQWIVVGHSMGGGVSLILTTKHTEQVSAVLPYLQCGRCVRIQHWIFGR